MPSLARRIRKSGKTAINRVSRLLPNDRGRRAARSCWEIAGASNPYLPDQPRKTRARQFAELLRWYLVHGEVNKDYQLYGLDVVGRQLNDTLPYRTFRRLRDRANGRGVPGRDMTALLEHKLAFYLLAQSLGVRTPAVIAHVNPSGVIWLSRQTQRSPLADLWHSDPLDAILKPNIGINGAGIRLLSAGEGMVSLDGRPVTADELAAELGSGEWIIQERVRQHPKMAAIYPHAVNTLRLVTVRPEGKHPAAPFIARMRIGVNGGIVDNWSHGSCGGILISLDPDSGRPMGPGVSRAIGTIYRHPNTGFAIEDLDIPYYRQAVQHVCRLHDELKCFHSVGWDVAVTEDGPTIIEGNDNWSAQPLFFQSKFRGSFLALLPHDSDSCATYV